VKVWVVTSHDGWGEGHDVDGVYVSLDAAQRGVKAAHPGIVFSSDVKASRVDPDDPGELQSPFIKIDQFEVKG
jgi:hypothetical protein